MILAGVVIWIYMTGWYFGSRILKRNDIADTAWGLGFILIALINWLLKQNEVSGIVTLLVTVWGGRLAWHIYLRNRNKKEDARYEQFKSNPYWKVFMTQGLLMWLISWPIILANNDINWINVVGIAMWIVGFYFESTADKQLKDFLKQDKNKGKIMKEGLWAYSRHPNYFGEVTMWWGIWLLTFGGNWLSIIGPLTITILITRVSGVPLLEKRYEGNQEYEEYKRKVSVLIPWFPKK